MEERNFTFLFYGFTAAWVIMMIYVLTLAVREKQLRSEMDRLKRMIEGGGGER